MRRGRRRPWSVLLVAVSAMVLVACSPSPATEPSPAPPTAAASGPSGAEMSTAIERAITSGSVALDSVEAVLVTVDGQTVVTHYRNGRAPGQAGHVYSVTKSVLSALVGIALDEKIIADVDSPLSELLPRYRAQLDGALARVTLRQLLTMSAGFPDDDTDPTRFGDVIRQDGDAVAFILKRGLETPPGETFAYSNSSAHLVSAVLTEALRQADGAHPRTVLDYATEKLFRPLGIDTRHPYVARFRPDDPAPFDRAGFGWATDARGLTIGAGGLRLRPADLLAFGQLYLDGGTWRGRPVVPAQWVADSITPSPADGGYGLMWWLETTPTGRSAYAAVGFGGQLVMVVPDYRLVVVVTSRPTDDYALDHDDVVALVSDAILSRFPP